MKYICVILFVSFASISFGQEYKLPERGYEWEVGVGLSAIITSEKISGALDLSTVHGFRFNPKLFVGVGIATLDTKYLATYGQFIRALRKPSALKPSYPLLSVKMGYSVSAWGEESHFADEKGIYIEPVFAWSFYSKAGNLRYNVFAALNYYNFFFIPKIGLSFTL